MTFDSRVICGIRVDASSYRALTAQVLEWARNGESRMLCFASVHMAIEALDSPAFRRVLLGADVVSPDGMPLVWALRVLGIRTATRVYGPDFMLAITAAAAEAGVPIALYGGSPQTLARLIGVFAVRYPKLKIACAISPPFRSLNPDEFEDHLARIRDSGAGVVLVGIGCPKQEYWMQRARGKAPAVFLGVGAAFDFAAGVKQQAPRWMMAAGLEWFFRLVTEPRRLWPRYLTQTPRFIPYFLAQLWRTRWKQNRKRVPQSPAP